MGNKIDLDLANGIMRDSHGNLNVGESIVCANGALINKSKDISIVEGHGIEAAINAATGQYLSESEASVARRVLGDMLQEATGDRDQQVFSQADIGSLETPMKRICDNTSSVAKGK